MAQLHNPGSHLCGVFPLEGWPAVMVMKLCKVYLPHWHQIGVRDSQMFTKLDACQQICHAILCLIPSQLDTEGLVTLEPRT